MTQEIKNMIPEGRRKEVKPMKGLRAISLALCV
jgi:hypothetical protein